jgi:anti-anti-sigma factor
MGSVPPTVGRRPGSAEVGHVQPGLAYVNVHGEHDLCTQQVLKPALTEAAAHSNVIVDLSDCDFIDSMVVVWLIQTAREVQARAEVLSLVIPATQTEVARVAGLLNLSAVFPVYPSRQAALAAFQVGNGYHAALKALTVPPAEAVAHEQERGDPFGSRSAR